MRGANIGVLNRGRLAGLWVDGVMHILRAFSQRGAPSRKVIDWSGRWWTLWGAVDLVPMGDKVLVVAPGFINPVGDAAEVEITRRDQGRLTAADGYSSYGEPVRRVRLLNGWDDLALTESYRERIRSFKADDRSRRPWAVPPQVT